MTTNDEMFAKYLKEQAGLNRLMREFKQKYISLGRYSGTVVLKNVSADESNALSNLFGRNVRVGDVFKTSFIQLEKNISYSKYAGFSWDKLFYYYFNENIISNKEKKNEEKNLEQQFFKSIIDENKDKKIITIYEELIQNDDLSKMVNNKYKRNSELLKHDLNNIILLLDNITSTPTSLSVYSSLTGDPHYLDLGGHNINLFLRVLSLMKNIEYPNSTIDKISLLEQINVYVDPISNFVITYKIVGNNILNELSNKNEVVNLNLSNILSLSSNIDTNQKRVYIFENPSILNSLKDLNVPMIITSGMPNLSLYKLLDVLERNGNKLYYNGDFDPEGLLIAQKLKDKYLNLELFGYNEENYLLNKSDKKISESRLSKLNLISNDKLVVIKNLLFKHKYASYQENNMDAIKKYILENENNNIC